MTISTFPPLLLLSIILAGCAIGAINAEGDPPQLDALGNDAVLVMRVQPYSRVHIATGEKKAEGWWTSDERPWHSAVAVNAFPKDEFIVVRVKGTTGSEMYGVSRVVPKTDDLFKKHYVPCDGDFMPTFELPPGKVTYIGTIVANELGHNRFKENFASKAQVGVQEDLTEVKAKLAPNYPKVAAAMEFRPFVFRQLTKSYECYYPQAPVLVPPPAAKTIK